MTTKPSPEEQARTEIQERIATLLRKAERLEHEAQTLEHEAQESRSEAAGYRDLADGYQALVAKPKFRITDGPGWVSTTGITSGPFSAR